MPARREILAALAAALAALVVVAGCSGELSIEFDSSSSSAYITLAATNVTSDSIELVLGANFSGYVPLWRNGVHIGDVYLHADTTTTYVDRGLASRTQYCYQAGGYGLFVGDVWSNVICATTY